MRTLICPGSYKYDLYNSELIPGIYYLVENSVWELIGQNLDKEISIGKY